MKFSIGPAVFSDTPIYDQLTDIEQRLATLEAETAMKGAQHESADNAGPVTVPTGTFVEVVALPDGSLVAPREETLVRVYFEYEVSAPDGTILTPVLTGATRAHSGHALGSTSLNSGGAWRRVTAQPEADAILFAGVLAAPGAVDIGAPYVYSPVEDDGYTDYEGPLDFAILVARQSGPAGTVQVRNAKLRVDVL
jgi:hypothetical protein